MSSLMNIPKEFNCTKQLARDIIELRYLMQQPKSAQSDGRPSGMSSYKDFYFLPNDIRIMRLVVIIRTSG